MSSSSVLQDLQFLRSQPLASLVQTQIQRQILAGELAAGRRLNELDIARTLGISRAPVRECLRTLEQTGLVVSKKNYGVYVRTVTLTEAREIYQMRSYIDAGVGQELAHSIAASDLRQLEQMVARMEKAQMKREAGAYHEINMAFHERMVALVGNRKLLDVYRKLLNELTLYRCQSLAQPGAMGHSAAEHREILAAIKSGDGAAAGRVMRDHIMASSGRLQRAHDAPRTRKTK